MSTPVASPEFARETHAAHTHEKRRNLFLCDAVWFDPQRNESALRITALPGFRSYPDEFWAATNFGFIHFRFLVFIRAQRVYEAYEWRPAGDPTQPEPNPLWLLARPDPTGPLFGA